MSGDLLALGVVGALAALGATRRGSRADLPARIELPTRPKFTAISTRDADVYENAYDRAVDIALGTDWQHDDWEETGQFDSRDEAFEDLLEYAGEAESHNRSYSPWEFTAAELNAREDSEAAWDDYEAGIAAGLEAGACERVGYQTDPYDEPGVNVTEGALLLPPGGTYPHDVHLVRRIAEDGTILFAMPRGLAKRATQVELGNAGWRVVQQQPQQPTGVTVRVVGRQR